MARVVLNCGGSLLRDKDWALAMPEPKISPDLIDADAQKVIRRLTRNGFQAYLVGGCVRDLLLGRTPKDFDVATSATPAECRDTFRNCRIIGRRFRLAHVFFGQKIIETATFRANPRVLVGEQTPEDDETAELLIQRDNVFGTAEEDARRRDFTMNGLFYDLDAARVIDYVDGLRDLARRNVCTIGDPDVRFREDPVRILRAIKFAARLGFDIEDRTYRSLISHRAEITKSAPPRVMEEIFRLLRGGAAQESVFLLNETGVLRYLLPELDERLQEDPTELDGVLGAVDQLIKVGETPQNPVLLYLLAAPRLAPLMDEREVEKVADPVALIDNALGPLMDSMRISRRDNERTRQMLQVQRKLWQLRRRSGRVSGLLDRDWFPDALLAHAIFLMSRGAPLAQVQSELVQWRRQMPPGPLTGVRPRGPGDEQPLTVSEALDDEGPRKRRRRRRRGGNGGAATTTESTAAAPVADGDEDAVEGEDAVLDAFTAALREVER